jgi:hypothetical protein
MSGNVTEAQGGFQYLNAPFVCRPKDSTDAATWRLNRRHDGLALENGWSTPETNGIWTSGNSSTLRISLPSGLRLARLRWHGAYYAESEPSIVRVQGRDLGEFDLSDGAVPIPPDLSGLKRLEITLSHPNATSPLAVGASSDHRKLAYFLMALRAE